MSRSKITSTSKDLITDDGSVLVSLVQGEQIHLSFTLGWLTNISSYTITAKVVEANNLGDGVKPTTIAVTPQITNLPIIENLDADNQFKLVLPQTLSFDWAVQPTPDKPTYGFMDIEVRDTGVGDLQQVWKPVRGLIEMRYSPNEQV